MFVCFSSSPNHTFIFSVWVVPQRDARKSEGNLGIELSISAVIFTGFCDIRHSFSFLMRLLFSVSQFSPSRHSTLRPSHVREKCCVSAPGVIRFDRVVGGSDGSTSSIVRCTARLSYRTSPTSRSAGATLPQFPA